VRELPEVCRPGGRLDAGLLAGLVDRRNRCVHREGGIALSPEECREVLREARPRLEETLREVGFVCRYPLGFARAGLGPQAGASHRYALHSCMGARVQETAEAGVVEAAVRVEEDFPFVVAPDGARLLYLWPLLVQRVSPLTGRPTLYLFEGVPDKRRPFLTEVRGAAIDVREEWFQVLRDGPATGHAWLLERLRALPSPLALPADLKLAERLLPQVGGKLVGQKLGPNHLQAVIATGGMGTVYAAEVAGEPVAVKVIESPPAPGQVARFLREFDKLKRAGQHPGIIRCYDCGVSLIGGREYPWYSMELALGGSLRSRLEERRALAQGRLPWEDEETRGRVAEEFAAIADAVAHLHRLEIVHRDVRPDNVLIAAGGELRLSDFGLVKDLAPSEASLREGAMTSVGAVLGAWGYLAPEQAAGQDAGKPADVYALGVLLAEMSTGVRPTPSSFPAEGSPLTGWPALRKLPADLRKLIFRATDVDPGRRPADAAALRQEFSFQVAGSQ
jgi:hypothetical protein